MVDSHMKLNHKIPNYSGSGSKVTMPKVSLKVMILAGGLTSTSSCIFFINPFFFYNVDVLDNSHVLICLITLISLIFPSFPVIPTSPIIPRFTVQLWISTGFQHCGFPE